MERFTKAIEKSIENENWYSALTLALTIPDICGRISYPEFEKKSEKRYVKWFDKYMLHHYEIKLPVMPDEYDVIAPEQKRTLISGGDCYALRCALLHEGRNDVTSQRARRAKVSKFEFAIEEELMTDCWYMDGVIIVNLKKFCHRVCEGVTAWNKEYENNTDVQDSIAEILTLDIKHNPIADRTTYLGKL